MGVFRLLLAFAVLETHVGEHSSRSDYLGIGFIPGVRAAEIFFVLSGFYMALVLHEKYNRPGGARLFLQQRFLRLYPTYLMLLIFFLIVYAVLFVVTGQVYGAIKVWKDYFHVLNAWSILIYGWLNVGVLGQDLLTFFRQDTSTGQFYFGLPPAGTVSVWSAGFMVNPTAWSLSSEFIFYFIAPWLVHRSIPLQLLLLAASAGLQNWLAYAGFWPIHSWTYFFAPSELCYFVSGSLAYRFYRAHRERLAAFGLAYPWIFWLAALLVVIYRRVPLLAGHGLLVIFLALPMVPLLYARTRHNKTDRMIGELAYPFYLLHWNVLFLVAAMRGGPVSPYFEPICLATTLIGAWLFYRFIEVRTEKWRARVFERETAPDAAPPSHLAPETG
jgi:peptidoglycan/LPS O-acetylase OafA/YrhL